MIKLIVLPFTMAFVVLLSVAESCAEELKFSGFARAVAGKIDTKKATYEGYDDSISFSEKSLIAVQADYRVSSSFSASAQILLHTDEDRESGIEWLYLTYAPSESFQINIGRLRTPFLKYSDVIDVGFAYPWINAPQQLYSSYLFSQYEGANVRLRRSFGDVVIDFEAYYGKYQDELASSGINVDVEIDDMFGGVIEVNYGGLQLRTATISAPKVETTIDEIAPFLQGLRAAGFDSIAEQFDINDRAGSFLLGASYDTLNWYVSGEWMKVSSDIDVLANLESFYVSYGYYLDEVLLHLTFASSRQSLNTIDNVIPEGVSPELDQLYFAVEQLNSFFPTDDLDTWTLGARWDVKTNIAFKAELSLLNGKEGRTSFYEVKENNFDRNATLYQVAVEWIF
ncbi:hypothetical protein D1814_11145 [Alteromonas sp. BL110]|uniref:hypothetical protein n=1 Tax=Alteromonas sp. BL110 TaxID=1714845 RepID=UPI000E474207|nr:hypothetical protein [Alteromonas sp. BL110]AXT39194.1 hypothetical protein D1814_11145 [Alteromonas sp. BL110]RKM82323.1 hypothetical protein D7031_08410 [Alteromonas sp. BL110]